MFLGSDPAKHAAVAATMAPAAPDVTIPDSAPESSASRFPTPRCNSNISTKFSAGSCFACRTSGSSSEPLRYVHVLRALMSGRTAMHVWTFAFRTAKVGHQIFDHKACQNRSGCKRLSDCPPARQEVRFAKVQHSDCPSEPFDHSAGRPGCLHLELTSNWCCRGGTPHLRHHRTGNCACPGVIERTVLKKKAYADNTADAIGALRHFPMTTRHGRDKGNAEILETHLVIMICDGAGGGGRKISR